MKTKIKDIFFKDQDTHVESFAEANALLQKTILPYNVIVFTWEDGADLILKLHHEEKDCSDFMMRYLRLWSEGPPIFSAEKKKKFLEDYANPDLVEFCADLKANYQLEDATTSSNLLH